MSVSTTTQLVPLRLAALEEGRGGNTFRYFWWELCGPLFETFNIFLKWPEKRINGYAISDLKRKGFKITGVNHTALLIMKKGAILNFKPECKNLLSDPNCQDLTLFQSSTAQKCYTLWARKYLPSLYNGVPPPPPPGRATLSLSLPE